MLTGEKKLRGRIFIFIKQKKITKTKGLGETGEGFVVTKQGFGFLFF